MVNMLQYRYRYNAQSLTANHFCTVSLQCFDAVGWAAGRTSGL